MNSKTVTVDVRDDIRFGGEPFSKIMRAASGLGPGERLLLLAPFEPAPLFAVLQKQGFGHSSRPLPSGDWEVLFTRQSPPQLSTNNMTEQKIASVSTARDIVEVDARGLEPPQPMVKILETLAGLAQNAQLNAITDRRPMHLYARLEERGFTAETTEQSDGSFLTFIRRG